jgi:short-subunit dehydrogenase
VALITGASAGIGEAFAHVFAGHGFDLVLTARRADRLDKVAREVTQRYGIEARTVTADLADPAAPAVIVAQATASGRPVDVLVNNAGYGLPGRFLDSGWDEHARFIQVMVTAVTELVYQCLPGMVERQYGRIINVASLAGLVSGTAGHTLYGAAKAFVIKFSQSVALEARRHNVHVTALCPGFTYSEFHDANGMRAQVSRMPKWMWMDAEPVARDGYDAVMRGRILHVPGRVNRALALAARLTPETLLVRVMAHHGRKFRMVERSPQ